MQGYNKNNTIILDDYDEVYDTQIKNCIIAEPFKFVENNSENDNFFKNLIPKIQKHVLNKNKLNVKKININ